MTAEKLTAENEWKEWSLGLETSFRSSSRLSYTSRYDISSKARSKKLWQMQAQIHVQAQAHNAAWARAQAPDQARSHLLSLVDAMRADLLAIDDNLASSSASHKSLQTFKIAYSAKTESAQRGEGIYRYVSARSRKMRLLHCWTKPSIWACKYPMLVVWMTQVRRFYIISCSNSLLKVPRARSYSLGLRQCARREKTSVCARTRKATATARQPVRGEADGRRTLLLTRAVHSQSQSGAATTREECNEFKNWNWKQRKWNRKRRNCAKAKLSFWPTCTL